MTATSGQGKRLSPAFFALYHLLLFTWGLSCSLPGAVLTLILRLSRPASRRPCFYGAPVTRWEKEWSMCLGLFLFVSPDEDGKTPGVLPHEWGHSLQCAVLGPLFWPLVALPSLLWAFLPFFRRRRKRLHLPYMSLFTEAQATRLGERFTGLPSERF